MPPPLKRVLVATIRTGKTTFLESPTIWLLEVTVPSSSRDSSSIVSRFTTSSPLQIDSSFGEFSIFSETFACAANRNTDDGHRPIRGAANLTKRHGSYGQCLAQIPFDVHFHPSRIELPRVTGIDRVIRKPFAFQVNLEFFNIATCLGKGKGAVQFEFPFTGRGLVIANNFPVRGLMSSDFFS